MPSPQSRAWCFTSFTCTAEPARALLVAERDIQYFIYQEEVCPETGRAHLQGYIYLRRKRSLGFVRRILEAHWERRLGTHQEAKAYCSKLESRAQNTTPIEFGEEPSPGRRSDIALCRDALLAGISEVDLLNDHSEVVAKFPNFVSRVRRHSVEQTALRAMPQFVPREGWQQDLFRLLSGEPDRRKVHWRWERTGNVGKSYFALHYNPAETFLITNGKHTDIYYAYGGQRVVILDWPRERLDQFSYGLLESFKNGYFLSTKYEAAPFRFKPPHVVVFANEPPTESAMSGDRWDICEIGE